MGVTDIKYSDECIHTVTGVIVMSVFTLGTFSLWSHKHYIRLLLNHSCMHERFITTQLSHKSISLLQQIKHCFPLRCAYISFQQQHSCKITILRYLLSLLALVGAVFSSRPPSSSNWRSFDVPACHGNRHFKERFEFVFRLAHIYSNLMKSYKWRLICSWRISLKYIPSKQAWGINCEVPEACESEQSNEDSRVLASWNCETDLPKHLQGLILATPSD
jgi:hypothetical protein